MKDGGRLAAAIEVLDDVLARRQPVKTALRDWGKRARYAGAKDRAWISGLVLDALRRRNSLAHHMASDAPRALILATPVQVWGWPLRKLEDALKDPHAPAPLSSEERGALLLAPDPSAPIQVQGDFPDWMAPHLTRAFGERVIIETQAMAVRAPVDLRVNTLKVDAEKAGKALRTVHAHPSQLLKTAFHIAAPDPTARDASLEAIPAYSRGWVEVQDAGSQIAAAAANVRPGDQVLDYCAGGGGKTLALAAMMEGKGQVHAYDIDGRRLSALIPRLKRSGAHNVQLVHPSEPGGLDPLKGQMDVVFIDAPCTGTGTWRRKPDTKWRVSEMALDQRRVQQREVLSKAADFVKPGGRLVYVTCSFLCEENEDQVAWFLNENVQFTMGDAAQQVLASSQLTDHGAKVVAQGRLPSGAVRLTPTMAGTDGFFFAVMMRG